MSELAIVVRLAKRVYLQIDGYVIVFFVKIFCGSAGRRSMAHRHTDWPKPDGERNLAKQLAALDDPHLHLWFGLDFIPGVRDIDILVWHEKVGVFVIEVKAVPLSHVEIFGWKTCKIKDRKRDTGPQYQAYKAHESFRSFLAPYMDRVPYISSTACWPLISRESWDRQWDDERVCGEYSERMIFQEDIFADAAMFAERLKYIWFNSPIRSGADYPFEHYDEQLQALQKVLSVEARPQPAPSDLMKLQEIERRVIAEVRVDAPEEGGTRILYYGHPGTGKTFRLLETGFAHALAGRQVLFVCYNKVLAADVRRLLSHSVLLKRFDRFIQVYDVFDMLTLYAADQKIDVGDDYDMWGELIVDEMRKNAASLDKFDTVLIDEAQDMKDWALSMLQLFTMPNATISVAAGTGQELYGNTSQWLQQFRSIAVNKRLNRNFRNTRPVFQLAQTFYEANMDRTKIQGVLKRFSGKAAKKDEQAILFDRPEGQFPLLQAIDESETSAVYS